MNFTLNRNSFLQDGIFSQLIDHDGNIIAHTLEHAYQQEDGTFKPKIPSGTFKCVRGEHELHGMAEPFSTFEITGIEGHKNLLFHWGNYNKDSEGCILVGSNTFTSPNGITMITNSRSTFEKFMEIVKGLDEFVLTVV